MYNMWYINIYIVTSPHLLSLGVSIMFFYNRNPTVIKYDSLASHVHTRDMAIRSLSNSDSFTKKSICIIL